MEGLDLELDQDGVFLHGNLFDWGRLSDTVGSGHATLPPLNELSSEFALLYHDAIRLL